ncbi:MAG: hypothetical protein MJ109_02300 [Kiritimatiellae bacterium]|nr:hypothetical protein [Kiritimatiellia bacterium]
MELQDIERELAGADKMAAMAKYDETLVALQGRAKEALRIGLPSEEFSKVQALDEVVTVARKLLRLQVRD